MMCKPSNSRVQVKSKSAWLCIKSILISDKNRTQVQVKYKSGLGLAHDSPLVIIKCAVYHEQSFVIIQYSI